MDKSRFFTSTEGESIDTIVLKAEGSGDRKAAEDSAMQALVGSFRTRTGLNISEYQPEFTYTVKVPTNKGNRSATGRNIDSALYQATKKARQQGSRMNVSIETKVKVPYHLAVIRVDALNETAALEMLKTVTRQYKEQFGSRMVEKPEDVLYQVTGLAKNYRKVGDIPQNPEASYKSESRISFTEARKDAKKAQQDLFTIVYKLRIYGPAEKATESMQIPVEQQAKLQEGKRYDPVPARKQKPSSRNEMPSYGRPAMAAAGGSSPGCTPRKEKSRIYRPGGPAAGNNYSAPSIGLI